MNNHTELSNQRQVVFDVPMVGNQPVHSDADKAIALSEVGDYPTSAAAVEQSLCERLSYQLLAALIRSATISAIKMTVGLVATDGTSGMIEASPV